MPVNNTTANRAYQLVHPSNDLDYDVARIIAAINGIDVDVQALISSVSGKAAAVHGHAIADITGLQAALDGKLSAGGSIAIANVTGLQTALDALAPKNNATFTGTTQGVTPANGANDTQFATTAWVRVQGYLTAVVTANINDGAVTSPKLGANAVTAGKLADGAVDTTARLADGIVSPAKATDALKTGSIGAVLDGGGATLVVGETVFVEVPYACTIVGWRIVGDATGSVVVDVKRATYANFPTTASIAASAKPTLSSARKNQNTTLTGWTTSLAAGDWIEFRVDSASGIKRATVQLTVVRT